MLMRYNVHPPNAGISVRDAGVPVSLLFMYYVNTTLWAVLRREVQITFTLKLLTAVVCTAKFLCWLLHNIVSLPDANKFVRCKSLIRINFDNSEWKVKTARGQVWYSREGGDFCQYQRWKWNLRVEFTYFPEPQIRWPRCSCLCLLPHPFLGVGATVGQVSLSLPLGVAGRLSLGFVQPNPD